jgi:lysozyme
MQASQNAYDLIKGLEGLELTAYRDISGKLTIGYGTTEDVIEGMVINEDKATELLKRDIDRITIDINRVVKSPLTQNQFDALVSFVYNEGIETFKKSHLRKLLNLRDYRGAAQEFLNFIFIKQRGTKIVAKGLIARRTKEKDLFLKT